MGQGHDILNCPSKNICFGKTRIPKKFVQNPCKHLRDSILIFFWFFSKEDSRLVEQTVLTEIPFPAPGCKYHLSVGHFATWNSCLGLALSEYQCLLSLLLRLSRRSTSLHPLVDFAWTFPHLLESLLVHPVTVRVYHSGPLFQSVYILLNIS